MPKEADIERAIVRYVEEELGGLCLKLVIVNQRGWPDRTAILPDGKVVFLEVKQPRGRVSPQQKFWGNRLKSLGHEWHVVRSVAEVKKVLK